MKILAVKPSPGIRSVHILHRLILLEPLELGYLAAAVPQHHDVKVLDLRIKRRPLRTYKRTVQDYKPDIVALSAYTHEINIVKELAQRARALLPDSLIVVGGHHATVLPEDFNMEYFDAVVRSEGCAPFRSIVEAAPDKEQFANIPRVLVPGISSDDEWKLDIPVYPDLATLPLPRRDLWDSRRYRCVWPSEQHPQWQTIFPPVATVRTSFGCRMECTFCVVPRLCGRKVLTRPTERIAEELENLEVDHVYFCDDETFINTQHARAVAETIKQHGINKRYFAWARSTTVNKSPDLFKLWRSIGLDAVFLGFEAITDSELDNLAKHSSVEENEHALATLREMGIAVHVGFMVRPEYTAQDFERLIQYVSTMPPAQVTFTVYNPSPGSPAWYEEREQFVCNPYTLHDCMHPLTKTTLPLREFYRYFARLTKAGNRRNPLRSPGSRLLPRDIARVIFAGETYIRSLKKAYRDFPRNMW